MTSVMNRRAFIGALGLGALGGACTRPAIVHANTNRDGINYSSRGGYADLDFAALVAQHGGGIRSGPTGGYRLGQIGKRWVFVDPLGKVFLLRGLYKASYDQTHAIGGGQQAGRTLVGNLTAKYGAGGPGAWEAATAVRFRKFHFNGTGSASRFLGASDIPDVMQRDYGMYSLHQPFMVLAGISEAVKDILRNGVKQNLPGQDGWVGRNQGDWFDPKYKQYIDSTAAWGPLKPDSNKLFLQADDGDYNYILIGAGTPDEVGTTDIDKNWVPHGGMVALISRPTMTSAPSPRDGHIQTWTTDTLNHTKRALIDQLIAKYRTIAALNAAWNTSRYYTTFESAGGWGVGTGLLDEDGMRPRTWFGKDGAPFYQKVAGQNDFFNSTRWNANVKIDLDLFLQKMAEAYLKPVAGRIEARWPGALFIGSTGLGGRNAAARAPVIAAHGLHCHLIMAGGIGFPNATQVSAFTRLHLGRDIPMIQAIYYPNNDDGCMYYVPRGDPSQVVRGNGIAGIINQITTARAPDGTYFELGYLFWGLYDQPGEKIGWGLVSYNDNPYDGLDYRVARADPYNPQYTTRTEDRVYGDAITPIKNANIAMFTTIQTQFGS